MFSDIFEDFVSPVSAAQTLLHSACKKRKDMLQDTMQFILRVLTAMNADAKQKDGALHMVISIFSFKFKKYHIFFVAQFYSHVRFLRINLLITLLSQLWMVESPISI